MLIETLIEEFRATLTETSRSVLRCFAFPEAEKMIKVATGMRRAGKTWFLYQSIHSLIEQGVPLETILYINFEDNRLLPMDASGMARLIESFYTLYPENHHRRCYLFLDGLQSVSEWQLVLRRFFDSKNLQIYVTGSSAKLLNKEIAFSLRGRSLSVEIWPYDFNEYLFTHGVKKPNGPIGKVELDTMGKHFSDFLNRGGFPAVQELSDTVRRQVLQSYVETVIFRDVIERHHVTNIALLKYLTNTLLKNFACVFSVNKFYNDIKSQGYSVAKDTIYNYIAHLEDAYLIATVPVYTQSLRHAQITPKKIYAVDNGLIQANIFSQSNNVGRLLENQIYLDLRRENKKIFFYNTQSGYEVDFVTESQEGEKEIIQVTWDMQDKNTRLREERALKEAQEELGIPGRIIDREMYLTNFLKQNKSTRTT